MSKFGLIVTINKINESIQSTFTCLTIDECYIELIKHISCIFNTLQIDFPIKLDDFEYIWFQNEYTKNSSFTYFIFENDKWITPWCNEDIYIDILNKMEEYEIYNKNLTIESDSDNES